MILLLAALFIQAGCESNISDFTLNERFYIEYNVSGGFAGVNKTLIVDSDDSVRYSCDGFDLQTVIDRGRGNEIRREFLEQNFFGLKNEYLPDHPIADGFYSRIVVRSSAGEKSVFCSLYNSLPGNLQNIMKTLDSLISELRSRANAGRVTVYRKSAAEPWPFYDKMKPEDFLGKTISGDESIFNLFKENYNQKKKILHFHDNLIYDFGDTGGYAMPFSTLDYKLTVHNSKAPLIWVPAQKLLDVSENDIILKGEEYSWLKEILGSTNYPRHFMNDSLRPGADVFEINLTHIIQ